MGFTLKVNFHGTVALVPGDANRVMRMVLGSFPAVRPLKPQSAYVRFPAASLSAVNTRSVGRPDPNDSEIPQANFGLGHVVLDREFLEIEANVQPRHQTLMVNDFKDPIEDSETPVKKDERSLYWLPHLERITAGTGTFRPELLAHPLNDGQVPANGVPGVAARLDLKNGYLETAGVEKERLTFRTPTGDPFPRSVARQAVFTLDVKDDFFVLRSKPMYAGQSADTTRDMRFEANGATEIEIVIGNEPEDEIYHIAPPILPSDQAAKFAAAEFSLYYTMSTASRPVAGRPPFVGNLPFVGGRRPNGVLCIGGVYQPVATT